jgi:4-diphosphocytidyl-2-C-methyl-D-erythritol kinase
MLTIQCFAKVNLFLEITGDRGDGYHNLRMLMQSISLGDHIMLTDRADGHITLTCNHPQVPQDHTNLAYRAVLILQGLAVNKRGVNIVIHKQIPIGGGLAGGSANGAAVLVGLNHLWGLNLSQAQLQELALGLGSDVPFCVVGSTSIAEGRGEILTPVPHFPKLDLVVAKPQRVSVSTPWAYQTFRQQQLLQTKPPDLEQRWQSLLQAKTGAEIAPYLYNDLERVVLPAYPPIAQIKHKLQELGARATLMSGSGACVFGISANWQQAVNMAQALNSEPDIEAWAVHTLDRGIVLD